MSKDTFIISVLLLLVKKKFIFFERMIEKESQVTYAIAMFNT
jgi:hypothetical protein